MAVRLGKGFGVRTDKSGRDRIADFRHKLGSKSDQIRKAKSRKPRAVSKIKAMTLAQKAPRR